MIDPAAGWLNSSGRSVWSAPSSSVGDLTMVRSPGSTALRAGRFLLPLAAPACCVIVWILLSFPSSPVEVAVLRVSLQPRISLTGRLIVDTPPPPERPELPEIVHASSPPPPLEGPEIVHASPPPMTTVERRDVLDMSSPPPPARPAETEVAPPASRQEPAKGVKKPAAATDRCAGRYIYIHELPSQFNSDLLRDCRSLSEWTDMCRHVANSGMGSRLTRTGGVLPSTGWYDTNQFTLEVIFHNRMKQYGCLTTDASRAAAVYVPYYAGLDVGRYLWGFSNGVRDALAEDLVEWLVSSPAWAAHGGRDHFFVGGRIAWDLMRDGGDWGSRLLLLPEAMNMTALFIEASPWDSNSVGVPYPTYFHPSSAREVASWQRTVRRARRPWLFAFAGGVRTHGSNGAVRDMIIDQCARSRRCGLLRCGNGRRNDCYAPGNVMRLFKSATFCLQPQGDSYTRRSAFDAMLAGCVPVFFHPGSAYVQYRWHLPANHRRYSVFVPEDAVRNGTVRLEDVLRRFSAKEVAAMREQVMRMVPSIVYRDPRVRAAAGLRDAVDVAVDGVIERVRRIKNGLLLHEREDHQWDTYFDNN